LRRRHLNGKSIRYLRSRSVVCLVDE
jgi:hypothetical protein